MVRASGPSSKHLAIGDYWIIRLREGFAKVPRGDSFGERFAGGRDGGASDGSDGLCGPFGVRRRGGDDNAGPDCGFGRLDRSRHTVEPAAQRCEGSPRLSGLDFVQGDAAAAMAWAV